MKKDDALPSNQLKAPLEKIDPEVLQKVMPPIGGVITMMFTDIVDSTKVKAQIGDQAYFEALKGHNALVRECVSAYKGRELKTIGDAFLIGFALPADGLACASEIQQRLATSPIQVGSGSLQLRIGLHTGTPIVYRDEVSKLIDLSGTDVDKAARVQGLAGGGQVLISEVSKTLAKPKETYDWGQWELKGLGRHRIFEVLWPGKRPERPSGRPWVQPVRFLTSFVGRETKIAEIMDAMAHKRLVTLKGMGGIGKTRLADEVAARVSQQFDDGVFFVELGNIENSERTVASELVARLGLKAAGFPDEATALQETLRNRKALLVLDNFEAVMSAAPFVERLLRKCPGLSFLVTSQRLLDVSGEQQFQVLPMATLAGEPNVMPEVLAPLDSFQLFRDRARLKKPDWDVSQGEAALIAEILELTDGIPLSIELAAAWVDRITLQTLREGLKGKRSEYLKRSGPSVEEKRHAGITACIDWSFNLLPPEEQALFAQVSVFVGGLFAEDVAQICQVKNAASILDTVRGKSLLLWDESLGKTRYRMLPTVREYATEKLADQVQSLQQRHAQRFLEVLHWADDRMRGKEQIAGIARISADLENIRAGMETAVRERDHRTVLIYSQAFGNYLQVKGWLAELLRVGERGLSAAETINDAELIAGAQNNLGAAYAQLPTGDRGANLQKAIVCFETALRVRTERDLPVNWAMTQRSLGVAYADLPTGDRGANLQKAIVCFEAALRVQTEWDFPVQWANTQNNLGNTYAALPTGDRGANLQKAIAYYEAAARGFLAAGLADEGDRINHILASLKREQ
jgi:predicted ATPase/class 3 adenylate cyclase